MKILANDHPKHDPIDAPAIYSYIIPLRVKAFFLQQPFRSFFIIFIIRSFFIILCLILVVNQFFIVSAI